MTAFRQEHATEPSSSSSSSSSNSSRNPSEQMMTNFETRMRQVLQEHGFGRNHGNDQIGNGTGNTISQSNVSNDDRHPSSSSSSNNNSNNMEQTLRQFLDEFRQELRQQFLPLSMTPVPATAEATTATAAITTPVVTDVLHGTEDSNESTFHFYLDSYKRVPQDWYFPRCTVLDLWRQWWIGDTIRNVPPLRYIKIQDVKHLDDVVVSTTREVEMEETQPVPTQGRNPIPRRKSSKTLSDMKFLMEYIKNKVQEQNLLTEEITVATVDRMYEGVADILNRIIHNGHTFGAMKWSTAVTKIRKNMADVGNGVTVNATVCVGNSV